MKLYKKRQRKEVIAASVARHERGPGRIEAQQPRSSSK